MFIVWKTEKKKQETRNGKHETEMFSTKLFVFLLNEPIRSKIYQMLIHLPKLRLNQF